MIYLILSILGCSGMALMLKLAEEKHIDQLPLMAVNYFAAAAIATFQVPYASIVFSDSNFMLTLAMAVLSGAIYLLVLYLCQYNVRINGAILASTFMQLGVVIPIAFSFILWKESPDTSQIIGIILSVLAVVLISYKKGEKRKTALALLLLLLASAGFSDSLPKMFNMLDLPKMEGSYMALTFSAAFIFCLILVVVKKKRFRVDSLWAGCLLGIANYFSSWFLLKSVGVLPSFIVYPCYSVLSIAIVAVVSVIVFKEVLSRTQGIGIGILLAAIILLN